MASGRRFGSLDDFAVVCPVRALDHESGVGQIAAEHGGGLVVHLGRIRDDGWRLRRDEKRKDIDSSRFDTILRI